MVGHAVLSFMEEYSEYNQILMYGFDEEKISFMIDQELFCYKAMAFGLENVITIYQRLVKQMLTDLNEYSK